MGRINHSFAIVLENTENEHSGHVVKYWKSAITWNDIITHMHPTKPERFSNNLDTFEIILDEHGILEQLGISICTILEDLGKYINQNH